MSLQTPAIAADISSAAVVSGPGLASEVGDALVVEGGGHVQDALDRLYETEPDTCYLILRMRWPGVEQAQAPLRQIELAGDKVVTRVKPR